MSHAANDTPRTSPDRQEILQHIYGRAGKVCAHKAQVHIRDFADGGDGPVEK